MNHILRHGNLSIYLEETYSLLQRITYTLGLNKLIWLRSKEFLRLIKYATRQEVRGQGTPTHSRRPFEELEFRTALSVPAPVK